MIDLRQAFRASILIVLFSSFPVVELISTCEASYFHCHDNSDCIHPTKICNHQNDCDDHSDESIEMCNEKLKQISPCSSNSFRCTDNYFCIPLNSVCDTIMDCEDGSDEYHCGGEIPINCEKLCGDSMKCINRTHICDGKIDCPFGDDELWCNSTYCVSAEYRCGESAQCVSESAVCNGYSDCRNNADETNCSLGNHYNQRHVRPHHGNQTYPCDIPNKCKKCFDDLHSNCICPHGYELLSQNFTNDNKDTFNCIDIDECQLNISSCSQQCVNIYGGYECRCYENFMVSPNNSFNCIKSSSEKQEPILLYTTPFEINYLKIDQNFVGSLNISIHFLSQPHYFCGVDYFWNEYLTIFWSDVQMGRILMAQVSQLNASINTIHVIYTKPNMYVTELQFDPDYYNLYWYDDNDKTMSVINLSNKKSTILFHNVHIKSLIMDRVGGRLYWIDNIGYYGSIVSCTMNGNDLKVLGRDRRNPSGLCLDAKSRQLYWIENNAVLIQRSLNVNDGRIRVVGRLNLGISIGDVVRSGVMIHGNILFYSIIGSQHWGRLLSVNVTSGRIQWFMLKKIIDIKSLTKYRVSKDINLCRHNQCHHLCLPDKPNSNYTCHCEQGYELQSDLVNCLKSDTKVDSDYFGQNKKHNFKVMDFQLPIDVHKSYRRFSIGTILFSMIILMIIISSIIYFIIKRRRSSINTCEHKIFHNRYEYDEYSTEVTDGIDIEEEETRFDEEDESEEAEELRNCGKSVIV